MTNMDGVRALDAIVFDLDGTLADTLRDIAGAMNRALLVHGMPTHAPEVYRPLIGEGARELARKVLPADAQGLADELLAGFRRDYFAQPIVSTAPYPGIPEVLEELVRARVPLAVLSNKPQAPTVEIVAKLFPSVPFVAVHGERPPVPRKPDPHSALELASTLGTPPTRCALVGDSEVDMLTAVAAQMLPIGVLWGFRDEAKLRASGAVHLLQRPIELLRVLDQRS